MITTDIPSKVDRDTVEFIRLGYNGAGSLDFTVTIPNYETFAAAMAAIGGYNRFDGVEITGTFRNIWDMAAQVEVGRDGSACLYVTLPFWIHQRHDTRTGGGQVKYTAEERQEMAQTVIDWARTVEADIVRVWQHPCDDPAGVVWKTGDSPYRIRVWWD